MMAAQSPLDCKDANDSDWMRNDQQLSPCRVLASSIQQFDPAFNLTWLDLSFHCPSASNSTNQALSGICCSSITFSLYSACWSCQFDQLVQGVVHTTWGDFASNCSLQSNGNGQQSRGQIGSLPASVQSKLSAAEIHLPPWTFLPTSDNATWDEAAAKLNATSTSSGGSGSHKLSTGSIVGIALGTFALFCAFIIIITVICMRKQQRSRIQSYQQRFQIFRPKTRVVNAAEKGAENRNRTPGTAANRLLDTTGRVNLAMDDELASPESAKGYKAPRRLNSDMDMEITHEAMLPALTGAHEAPDRPGSAGTASRFASSVRRSLGRVGSISLLPKLGRHSQPSHQALVAVPFTMPSFNGSHNRYTHPIAQPLNNAPPIPSQPFSVPLSPQQAADDTSRSRTQFDQSITHPPTSWTGYNASTTHPPHSVVVLSNTEPTPLTKEALEVVRAADDGTLFVPNNIAKWRQTAIGIPPTENPRFDENEHLVHTVSIERAKVSRNQTVPHRSDSLGRRPLVLHEAPIEGVPKKKSQSKPKARDPLDNGDSSAGAGYSAVASNDEVRPSAPLLSPLEGHQPSSSSRPFPTSASTSRALPAPVAKKPLPKSNFSSNATAGSGKEQDDVSLEIQKITSSPRGQGSNGNAKLRGKKLSSEEAVRQSLATYTSYTGGNLKSDASRTPSPKVAPSAEWFDLFRRGTVPSSFTPGLSSGNGESGTGGGEASKDLTRNKTAPALSSSKQRDDSFPSASAPKKIQPLAFAPTSFTPNPALSPGADFYGAPIAATYTTSSTPYLAPSLPSSQPAVSSPPIITPSMTRTASDVKPISPGQGITLNRSRLAPVGARPPRMLPPLPPGAVPPPEE